MEGTWHRAQAHELEWWRGIRNRLLSPGFLQQKEESTLRLWEGVRRLAKSGSLRVLEIGPGGDGLVNFIPDAYGVAIDPLLPAMRREGIGIFRPSARFLCGVGERLPFRDNSFDVVFSYNVLDHTQDPQEGLDEIARVLRPGGVMHLLVNTYSAAARLYRGLGRPDPMHPHTFTAHQVHRWLKSRGFRVAVNVSDATARGKWRQRAVRIFCLLEKAAPLSVRDVSR